jgi:hypothetical protein
MTSCPSLSNYTVVVVGPVDDVDKPADAATSLVDHLRVVHTDTCIVVYAD